MGPDGGTGYAEAAAVDASTIDAAALGREAADKARATANAVSVEPGDYPVVLEEYAVVDLLDMLGYLGFSALAVQEERSFVEPGKRIGSDLVTIIDDGYDPAGLPLWFDFEGVAKQRVTLVERGVCRGVVYDAQTAARDGVASTGHGLPAPNPYGPFPLNMVMDAGTVLARGPHRGPGSRPARDPLPLHEPGPPEARDRHRHDPRRHVPRRGRHGRRAGQEPALHAELPRRPGGDRGGRPRATDAQGVPRRGRRAGRPHRRLDVHGRHGALMARGAEEIWVCASCRSVNKARARQCYNCRTPRHLAEVDPSQIQATGHGPIRDVALPPFRASRGRSVLASLLVLAVAALQVASVVIVSGLIVDLFEGAEVTDRQTRIVTNLDVASLGVALLALVAWAAWLSRVVTEMPALGLGYPAATGLTAFLENFVPIRNLFRVPAIVRDVDRRLTPNPGRGDALIAAAWIGIFGGFLIPRIGTWINGIGASSAEMAVRNQLVFIGIGTGFTVAGAIFFVATMWWIEVRIARRRLEQMALAPATPATPIVPATRIVPAAPVVPAAPAAKPGPIPEALPEAAAPSGPHLVVHVDADGALVAELDGESEPLTLDELRAAAEALARAGGSATVQVAGPAGPAGADGHQVLDILSDAGVATTYGV